MKPRILLESRAFGEHRMVLASARGRRVLSTRYTREALEDEFARLRGLRKRAEVGKWLTRQALGELGERGDLS